MLILSRKAGESIQIGDDVTVKVTSIAHTAQGPRVRIGIYAPAHVPIVREELLEEDDDYGDYDDER